MLNLSSLRRRRSKLVVLLSIALFLIVIIAAVVFAAPAESDGRRRASSRNNKPQPSPSRSVSEADEMLLQQQQQQQQQLERERETKMKNKSENDNNKQQPPVKTAPTLSSSSKSRSEEEVDDPVFAAVPKETQPRQQQPQQHKQQPVPESNSENPRKANHVPHVVSGADNEKEQQQRRQGREAEEQQQQQRQETSLSESEKEEARAKISHHWTKQAGEELEVRKLAKKREDAERRRQQQSALSQVEAELANQFVTLHGQRVSLLALRRMCRKFKEAHQGFLADKASRQLELGILFAASRLRSRFDTHMAEKRLRGHSEVSCAHGVSIAMSHEGTQLQTLLAEAMEASEKVRLHLLDLADGWTLTQTKDSDLVEESVSSLHYYTSLDGIANDVLQSLSFLRGGGALAPAAETNCLASLQKLSTSLGRVPEGAPNWTHLKVGVDLVLSQCDRESTLLRNPNADL